MVTAALRPSLARSAMMRSAARTPHATPLSWGPPSGTAASDWASLASRLAFCAGKYVVSTRCAAAAAAASGEAFVGRVLVPAIHLVLAGDADDRVVHREVGEREVEEVRRAGRGADTVDTVTSFQKVMTAGLAFGTGGLAATGAAVTRAGT